MPLVSPWTWTTPDYQAKILSITVTCADGDSIIGVAVLNGFGYSTINQMLAQQTTAGP